LELVQTAMTTTKAATLKPRAGRKKKRRVVVVADRRFHKDPRRRHIENASGATT